MITLLSAEYENVVYFKKATVPLTANPITYVRGVNKNSDPAKPTGNGVGKSLLLSAMFNVPLGHPIITHKKRGNKDLFHGAESKIAFTFKPHASEHIFRVEQTGKGLKIFRDGEDLQLTGKTAPQEYLRKLFPINEEELFITQYVTSLRDYPLQVAKDDQRLQMIISLFRLDQYSQMHAFFQRKLREVKDSETRASVIEAELLKLRGELYDCPATMTRSEYEALEAEAKEAADTLQFNRREVYALESRRATIESLGEIEGKLDRYRKAYRKYGVKKDPDSYVRELRAASDQLSRYEDYLAAKKLFDKKSSTLQASLSELKPFAEVNLKRVGKRIEKIESLLADVEENKRRHATWASRLAEAEDSLKEHVEALTSAGLLDVEYEAGGKNRELFKALERIASESEDELRESIGISRSLMKLERLVHEHGDAGTCPTCTQPINVKSLDRQIKIARKSIKRDEARLRAIREAREGVALFKELVSLQQSEPESSDLDVSALSKELAHLEEQRIGAEEYRACTQRLALLEEHAPKRVKKPEIDLDSDELARRVDFCSSIVKLLSKKEGLVQGDAELQDLRTTSAVTERLAWIDAELKKRNADLSKNQKVLSEMQERLQQAKRVSSNRKLLKKQIAQFEQQTEEFKPLIARKRQYEVLVKAYSTKGLRAFAARSVCELLERNLNTYRPLAFMEPYEFSIEVSDSGVAIMVDRKKGPKTDVRLLSGAESDSFRLLCLLAVLPLLPDSLRINLAILDEPCSHMDEASRDLIRDRYMPALKELVPNLFVITQTPEDTLDNSAVWTVIKSGNYSKLAGA